MDICYFRQLLQWTVTTVDICYGILYSGRFRQWTSYYTGQLLLLHNGQMLHNGQLLYWVAASQRTVASQWILAAQRTVDTMNSGFTTDSCFTVDRTHELHLRPYSIIIGCILNTRQIKTGSMFSEEENTRRYRSVTRLKSALPGGGNVSMETKIVTQQRARHRRACCLDDCTVCPSVHLVSGSGS